MSYNITTRERRITAGLCTMCGKSPPREGKRLCAACNAKKTEYARSYRKYDRIPAKKRKHRITGTDTLTLSEVCRLAVQHGVSYGVCVAMIAEGKIKKGE